MAKWEWFSVKLIFESIISGKPERCGIDKNYTNDAKTYEESIVLIKAQSFEHAYRIAEEKAKKREIEYTNPYGELVNWKFVRAVDCFWMNEDSLQPGVELYSRSLEIPKSVSTKAFIEQFYPETVQDDSDVDTQFILRNRDFNRNPDA